MDNNFNLGIYTLTDKSFICPESHVKPGDTIAVILPMQKVDPLNKYVFVITTKGSASVSRKFLSPITVIPIKLEHKPLETHNQLMSRKIKASEIILEEFIKNNKENTTFGAKQKL